jgi:hypothetical protein
VLHVEDLVLVALDAERPRVPPPPVFVEAGRIDDPIEGHQRRHDELRAASLVARRAAQGEIKPRIVITLQN